MGQQADVIEPALRTERFPVTDLHCVCCTEPLEAALEASPHIQRARLDCSNDAVEAPYHPSMIAPAEVGALISGAGRCCPIAAPSADMTHLHHRAQMTGFAALAAVLVLAGVALLWLPWKERRV